MCWLINLYPQQHSIQAYPSHPIACTQYKSLNRDKKIRKISTSIFFLLSRDSQSNQRVMYSIFSSSENFFQTYEWLHPNTKDPKDKSVTEFAQHLRYNISNNIYLYDAILLFWKGFLRFLLQTIKLLVLLLRF